MHAARPLRTLAWLATTGVLLTAPAAWAAHAFITVGTSDVTGIFYQAGGDVCHLVNADRTENQMRCAVSSTSGSIANIEALRHGKRAFGFAHGDIVEQAFDGTGAFEKEGAFKGLRVVFALNPGTVTLVARDGSGIDRLQDLRGKRVNIGPQGSGQRASVQSLMNAMGWTPDDFANASTLAAAAQAQALCDGRLDAAVFVTAHPDNAVMQALSCGARLIPIQGPAIDRLVRSNKFYSSTVIPGGTYAGQSDDVPTYGVSSLLLSSTNTARGVVYQVTKAVFDHIDAFRKWNPALQSLKPAGMARGTQAVKAPLHPGASMYYQDNDLL